MARPSRIGGPVQLGPPRAAAGPGPDRLTAPARADLRGLKAEGRGSRPTAHGPRPGFGRGHLGPIFEGSRPGGPDLMARPPRAAELIGGGLTARLRPRPPRAGLRGPRADGPGAGLTAHGAGLRGPRIGGPVQLGAAAGPPQGLDLIGPRPAAHLGPKGRRRAIGPNLGPQPALQGRVRGRRRAARRPTSTSGPRAHLGADLRGPRAGAAAQLGGRRAQDRAA